MRLEVPAAEAKKAGGCQLDSAPNTQSTTRNWECSLRPSEVVFLKVDINNAAQNGS